MYFSPPVPNVRITTEYEILLLSSIFCYLHRIHKILLDLVEDKDAEQQREQHEAEAIGQPAPADKLAGAQESVFEGLYYGSYWVEAHQCMERHPDNMLACGLAQRVNYRGGIHPERHQKAEQHLQVTILGGHG